MRVGRVVIHAPVTSFRYPFFVTGRQPTFDIPPPSTIIGQCACALGNSPDPENFFFGLHFVYRARGVDYEHQHITSALGGKTKTRLVTAEGSAPATTEATIVPVEREFLFDATLTLYIAPQIAAAFRSPAYTLTLGRSQDLAEVQRVDDVTLERSPRARLEHTLLPWELRPAIAGGVTLLLSRHISEPPAREAIFARYISLHEAAFLGGEPSSTRTVLTFDGLNVQDLWIDPSAVDDEGFPRAVWLHRSIPES